MTMTLVRQLNNLDVCDDNIRFDIFFIYKTNPKTRKWIKSTCDDLEKQHIVCGYHERDFTPGVEISTNIINCIKRSRKVGIVVTTDFKQSKWCQHDLRKALHDHINSEEIKILPMFLDVNENDIPEELNDYTGIDVSGNKENWWDKLVTAITEVNPDNTRKLHYHYQKLILALNEAGIDKAHWVINNFSRLPMDDIQRQIGQSHVMAILLGSCGIGITNRTVQIELTKLLPFCHQRADLQKIFNQTCSEQQICAALEYYDTDRRQLTFTPQCDIKLNGDNCRDIKLVMSFSGKQTIKLCYNSSNIMTLSLEKTTDIIDRAASTQHKIQLRSRQSRRMHQRLVPYRVPLHSSRGCKNYRNYRKVLIMFPNRLTGRYTFFRDKFRDQDVRNSDVDRFLCLQKNDGEGQTLVF